MNLFWVLCALLGNHWCLVDVKDSELCTSAGDLPAPDIFLSATLVHEGEIIAVLCTAPSEVVVTRFFFCKDGAPVSFRKATSQNVLYIINASLSNAGQYSCGYQQKDAKNQEKTSALSVAQNLILQSGALLANHWCLGDDKDSELCTSTGELPAPDLFLNKTLVLEGETITALCAAPADVVLTGFFFCKDGAPVSSKKATSQYVQYKVFASPKNAGQYSCGYQQKDAKNQVKISALSVAQNLIVQPGSYDSNGQTIPPYIWILRSSLVLLLLVSAPIFTYFMEKCNCSLVGHRN
ncbi:uncharacterized protein LOC118095084 isoform X2 [Zootoca vivipara]|uniref:uncharacterized protein LOC118095084 isoform X2 n=1 Tax=Zootoca vivipara TaxID=8524 RepID=UPI00159172B1|nr:uncharacterized protein LOC118095084 isoform X2 [Zootoca vivipara]